MENVVLAIYGRNSLVKKFCKKCRAFYIVIDGIFQCCGEEEKDDFNESVNIKVKRESECCFKRKILSEKEKDSILENQKFRCIYCDCDIREEVVHFDHFIPFSFTWSGVPTGNIVASCSDCNLLKSDKMFDSYEEVSDYVRERSRKRKEKRKSSIKRMFEL